MKNKLTIFFAISALALATSFSSSAQVVEEGTSHVFVGLGFPNIPGAVYTSLPGGTGSGSSLGPFCLSYQYGIKDKISVGGTLNYSSVSSPDFNGTDANGNKTTYNLTVSLVTIMATGNYHYLKSDKFDLYSGLSLGYGIASAGISGNKGVFDAVTVSSAGGAAWHLSALGARYMFTDKIGAYTEVGFGWNGLAQVGLSAKF